MPRSLASQIRALGFTVQDTRDIGLRGHSDLEVLDAAIEADAIINCKSNDVPFNSIKYFFVPALLADTSRTDSLHDEYRFLSSADYYEKGVPLFHGALSISHKPD